VNSHPVPHPFYPCFNLELKKTLSVVACLGFKINFLKSSKKVKNIFLSGWKFTKLLKANSSDFNRNFDLLLCSINKS